MKKHWFNSIDKLWCNKHKESVVLDISLNPDIENSVKEFRESFIKFACLERMNFTPNITEEFDEYLKRSRLYTTNNKAWKSLTLEVFKRDNYTCKYCQKKGCKLEADHVIPFSKGGGNEIENLVASCVTCNRQKKDKSIEEFDAWKLKKLLV